MGTAHTSNEVVVVTSDEPWGPIWHTQLHYAYQLSKRYQVIYFDPPEPWTIRNLFSWKQPVNKVSDTLTVIRYFNFLPSFLGKVALKINDFVNESLCNNLLKKNGYGAISVLWHFDPFRSFHTFRKNKKIKHIYHVVDPIAGSHLDVEQSLAADLVIITSPKFIEHYRKLNKNVAQIGQGADTQFFQVQESESVIQKLVTHDSILLLGTISDEIDLIFLQALANKFPHKLVLIGPDTTRDAQKKEQFQKLLSIDGVTWLGPMPPVEFRKHLQACKIGIIAYDNSRHDRNNLRSPLKVISYLAAGKSIVSNIDCEIASLQNKAIYNVTTQDEYFELIHKGYSNQLNFDRQAVNTYLQSIDYNELLRVIFQKINQPLAPLK
ncbi:MAG: hypothetical protein JNL49_15555 [Bacteroidia bacterium]|nr:hypothetical protein [Bacteroidia bacterium]